MLEPESLNLQDTFHRTDSYRLFLMSGYPFSRVSCMVRERLGCLDDSYLRLLSLRDLECKL